MGHGRDVFAQHLILAMPKAPLLEFGDAFEPEVQGMLDSVIAFPLLKCFFVTKKPWWDEDTAPQTSAEHIPTREAHYYLEHVLQLGDRERAAYVREFDAGSVPARTREEIRRKTDGRVDLIGLNVRIQRKEEGAKGWRMHEAGKPKQHHYYIQEEDLSIFDKNGSGMVMLYTDRPASEYWNDYVDRKKIHDRAAIQQNHRLIQRFLKYVREYEAEPLLERMQRGLESKTAALPAHLEAYASAGTAEQLIELLRENVEDYGIRDWGRMPYGAGCHAWRPGSQSWKVVEKLKAFGLAGSPGSRNIHITGEAFSNYQGFIEGALRTANAA